MKQLKILIIIISVLIVLWVVWLLHSKDSVISDLKEFAERSEQIDFNPDNGIAYINNEIILFAKENTSKNQIDGLSKKYGCRIESDMTDIDIYLAVFSEALTYEELLDMTEAFKKEEIIEYAYINTVTEISQ